jgi:hypothetical protein
MRKTLGFMIFVLGTSVSALIAGPTAPAPEIDPAAGMAALTLMSGGLLVIRGRRKK